MARPGVERPVYELSHAFPKLPGMKQAGDVSRRTRGAYKSGGQHIHGQVHAELPAVSPGVTPLGIGVDRAGSIVAYRVRFWQLSRPSGRAHTWAGMTDSPRERTSQAATSR